MDVVKFIEERKRMCAAYKNCMDCPAGDRADCVVAVNSNLGADEQLKIVEEWSDAHPSKTRQSVFLEQYPEAVVDARGSIDICPKVLCDLQKSCGDTTCYDCRCEFWSQEVS